MFSKGVIPLVNRPTRVTKNTATCIDHDELVTEQQAAMI